jgi:hypothetical protein
VKRCGDHGHELARGCTQLRLCGWRVTGDDEEDDDDRMSVSGWHASDVPLAATCLVTAVDVEGRHTRVRVR